MFDKQNKSDVIIFGAGPAGLAAAYKLIKNNKSIIIFEKENQVGGLSKTIKFKGYYFDLGGHRFFTKSEEVNGLWEETLGDDFLIRPRLSRIYYRDKFFNYPLKPANALFKLGIFTSLIIMASYLLIKLFPHKEEKTFEQWVSNRFGKKLFNIFFKTYTEKLWGVSCDKIQAEWARQRIKGLSLSVAVKNALFPDKSGKVKTLIDKFKYPKYGPGQMYEKMAENIEKLGGKIIKKTEVVKINHNNFKIKSIIVKDKNGNEKEYFANHFLSSMPITTFIKKLSSIAFKEVLEAANNLHYRSLVIINVILNSTDFFPDIWIYIHSPEVKLGRLQNFGNWSPYMLADKNKTTLGLEYFCDEGDELWNTDDKELINMALNELEKIKLAKKSDFADGFVVRVPKAYPVYDEHYSQNIKIIRTYLDKFFNIQPIGRYGMFKYNNMDHSILTGFYAAENILNRQCRHNIWEINIDQEYQEEHKQKDKNE